VAENSSNRCPSLHQHGIDEIVLLLAIAQFGHGTFNLPYYGILDD
jgi:hypothetical protein